MTGPLYSVGPTTYYGWYIKLNDNLGEKVLASPKVFDGTAFFSTYEPGSAGDACAEDNLGTSRLYAVKAGTGEAVYSSFDTTNDEESTSLNSRAESESGGVLRKTDRSITVGDGIASEPLIMINNKGAVSVMVGRGGGFFNSGTVESIDPVFPVYWMKW